MQELLARVGSTLRALGFHGTSRSYRKQAGDSICVVDFRGRRVRDSFYVELGAQPVFGPSRGDADLARLRAYDCVLQLRAIREWPRQMSASLFASFENEVISAQAEFFGHIQTLRHALAVDSPRVLMYKFGFGTSYVRTIVTLARAAYSLGHVDKAHGLAELGVEDFGPNEFLLAERHDDVERLLAGHARQHMCRQLPVVDPETPYQGV